MSMVSMDDGGCDTVSCAGCGAWMNMASMPEAAGVCGGTAS